jgi:hypothetical protein
MARHTAAGPLGAGGAAAELLPVALAGGFEVPAWLETVLAGADAVGDGASPCREQPSDESETSARTAGTLTTAAAS